MKIIVHRDSKIPCKSCKKHFFTGEIKVSSTVKCRLSKTTLYRTEMFHVSCLVKKHGPIKSKVERLIVKRKRLLEDSVKYMDSLLNDF